MINLISDPIYGKGFLHLRITDVVDFRAINVEPVIKELQNYFNENIKIMKFYDNKLFIPISSTPKILIDNDLINYKKEFVLICIEEVQKGIEYIIDKISVKYNESYDYDNFNEYNLDLDVVDMNKYDSISECLHLQKYCCFIESYCHSVYLEISLKYRNAVDNK